MQFNTFTYISTATTTAIATGNTYLHTIVIPIASAGAITIEQANGTDYFVLPIGSVGTLWFDCVLPSGLQVITASGDKVILNWHQ